MRPMAKKLNLTNYSISRYLLASIPWLERIILRRLPRKRKVTFFSCHQGMESSLLEPPRGLHGMKVLDKDAFRKEVVVLTLNVPRHKLPLIKGIKQYLIKNAFLKPILDKSTENRRLYFNPDLIKKVTDFDEKSRQIFDAMNLTEDDFSEATITLTYDNWNARSILRAVLPENEEQLKSFSMIGHIVHVNLKDHLLLYKSIIGQILLDKVKLARTVVTKASIIDNVYRNFEVELLCGEPDYNVTVKENGCTFQFDFSSVYWNPRLGTEHARVTDSLKRRDVLFDVFSGVGPFAIPAAKKMCTVYANDLNPEAIKALNGNIKLNKIKEEYIKTFNKDGADFICTDVKEKLQQLWKDRDFDGQIVVVMNLPMLALEFVKNFKGLFHSISNDLDREFVNAHLPIFHCYFFVKTSETAEHKNLIEKASDIKLSTLTDYSIHFVRDVSLNKFMYKITFQMPLEYLIRNSCSNQHIKFNILSEEPKAKKLCTRSD